MKRYFAGLTVICLVFSLSRASRGALVSQLVVKDGLIDLSNWDFSANDQLELKGDWKFIWKEFVELGEVFDQSGTRKVLQKAITESTYRRLSNPERLKASFVGEESVKGKKEKIRVWKIEPK